MDTYNHNYTVDNGSGSGESNETLWNIGPGGFDITMLRHSLAWTVVIICSYVLIFVVGTVGNVMVVAVLTLKSHTKTVTNMNMFILNLACADLAVIIFCVGPTLLTNILIPWVLGPFMCKAVAYVQGVSVCASAYSLVAISLDRFLAIWFPTKMPKGLTKFQARFIILCIWIASASIVSPWTVVFNLEEDADGIVYCLESWSSVLAMKLYFIVGNLILCYALPLCLVIISNGLIWIHVAKRKVPTDAASPAAIKRVHKKTRHGVLRMLTVVTLTFLLSWLPLYIIFVISKIGENLPEQAEKVIPFAQWLGASNSSCNPILYAFLNKKFRDSFRSLMSCPRNKNTNPKSFATGNSITMNNSTTMSISPRYVYRGQNRNGTRYPIVRV